MLKGSGPLVDLFSACPGTTYISCGDSFLQWAGLGKRLMLVQADDAGRLSFIEMAMDRIPDLGMKAWQIIRFSHDIHADSARDEPPSGASSTMKWISVMGASSRWSGQRLVSRILGVGGNPPAHCFTLTPPHPTPLPQGERGIRQFPHPGPPRWRGGGMKPGREPPVDVGHFQRQLAHFVDLRPVGVAVHVRQVFLAFAVDGDAEGVDAAAAGFEQGLHECLPAWG